MRRLLRDPFLLTALAPNTAYHYAVKSGRTLSSTRSFRAAPTTDKPFRIFDKIVTFIAQSCSSA